MKKINVKSLGSLILTWAIVLSTVPFAFAYDEGMFPPDKVVTLGLPKKGLKINPSEIYDPVKGGLSEAVIRLDTGCTGEFVSPNGLILTNHHCGFDALVSASSIEKDYGKDGYKADSMKNELPAKDYAISVPVRVQDVTDKIKAGTDKLSGEELAKAIKANIDALTAAEQGKVRQGNTVRVQAVSNGFYYYLYENQQIKDIRVVYAPPQMIGFFGGDPDNFEWTRHTGDFTFLRAYVAPDGSSAEYSPNNVPFKPRRFLTISLNGLKENDFVFVMGNPGGTTRYRESQWIRYAEKTNFPFLYEYLTAWINGLNKVGETDEAKRIALQSQVFSLANSQKLYQGGAIALRREGVAAARQREEAKLSAWINANAARKAKYGTLLADIGRVSADIHRTPMRDRLLRTMPNLGNTVVYKAFLDAVMNVQAGKPLSDKAKADLTQAFAGREPMVEREMTRYFFQKLVNLPADQRFGAFDRIFGKNAGLINETAILLSEGGDFNSVDKIAALYSMSLADIQKKYPALTQFALAHGAEQTAIMARTSKFNADIDSLRQAYMRALIEMRGAVPYPDANFTQRFTYGYVKGYRPREAVVYEPFTTLKGVLEKDTGVYPFDAPQKLKELQDKKDFGRYGVGDSVPVNFLSTNDIIGGNSGSPIMNAYGEQVGIVFDGNYEGLGNDLFFSPDYGRTISVDIRYVLFVTEKFGGAGWILDEMKIVGPNKRPTSKGKK